MHLVSGSACAWLFGRPGRGVGTLCILGCGIVLFTCVRDFSLTGSGVWSLPWYPSLTWVGDVTSCWVVAWGGVPSLGVFGNSPVVTVARLLLWVKIVLVSGSYNTSGNPGARVKDSCAAPRGFSFVGRETRVVSCFPDPSERWMCLKFSVVGGPGGWRWDEPRIPRQAGARHKNATGWAAACDMHRVPPDSNSSAPFSAVRWALGGGGRLL